MTEVLKTLHSKLGLRQHNKKKSFSLQFVANYEQIATPVWMICTYAAPSMQSPTPPQLNMSASTFPSFLEQPITSPLASRSHSTLSHHIPAQISNEVQRMFKRRFLALRPPTNSLHAHLRRLVRCLRCLSYHRVTYILKSQRSFIWLRIRYIKNHKFVMKYFRQA